MKKTWLMVSVLMSSSVVSAVSLSELKISLYKNDNHIGEVFLKESSDTYEIGDFLLKIKSPDETKSVLLVRFFQKRENADQMLLGVTLIDLNTFTDKKIQLLTPEGPIEVVFDTILVESEGV